MDAATVVDLIGSSEPVPSTSKLSAASAATEDQGVSAKDDRIYTKDSFATNELPDWTAEDSPATSQRSIDEQYMTLALIYSRISVSKRGCMASLIVKPPWSSIDPSLASLLPRVLKSLDLRSLILVHSNNTPISIPPTSNLNLEKPKVLTSQQRKVTELHAESRCISLAAQRGIPLHGTTLYVTFPPCKECFPLILAAGVKRVVFRRELRNSDCIYLARAEGVKLVEFRDEAQDLRMKEEASRYWKSVGETKERTKERTEDWWQKNRWPRLPVSTKQVKVKNENVGLEEAGEDDDEDDDDDDDEDVEYADREQKKRKLS